MIGMEIGLLALVFILVAGMGCKWLKRKLAIPRTGEGDPLL